MSSRYRSIRKHPRYWSLILGGLVFLGGQRAYRYPLPTVRGDTTVSSYSGYEAIPPHLRDSIIAIEDRRFAWHPGVDPIALARALYQTIVHHNTQGGSTIEQQLIKLTSHHTTRSLRHKITEMRYAINLQFHYSKQEILTSYINTIPFSYGVTGWHDACTTYFHKGCEYLTDSELSYLFAIAQRGSNPYKASQQPAIMARASLLCSTLRRKQLIAEHGCDPLAADDAMHIYGTEQTLDPKVALFLSQQSVHSQASFSPTIYETIENILRSTQTHREQYNAQYCCVMLVNATGDVISMNTCSDWNDDRGGKLNTCLEPRQVGSAIKPFLYLYGFHAQQLTSHDTVVDEAVSYDLGDGSVYSPKNFDLHFHGTVTRGFALGNSLNVPAIKMLDSVGVEPFLGFLKTQLARYASGYDSNTKDATNVGLSLALGTYEMSPYAFTQLRRAFLPGQTIPGYDVQTHDIRSIMTDPNNKVVSFGQDSFLNVPGRAVKTGTSRKFIDGRVCGTHADKGLSLCVRMGNLNNEAMKGPSSEVGSYIWSVIAKGL